MMRPSLFLGLGLGLAGAVLLASAGTGTVLSTFLLYAAPLPFAVAGLYAGAVAALAALGAAGVALTVLTGGPAGIVLLLVFGLPAALFAVIFRLQGILIILGRLAPGPVAGRLIELLTFYAIALILFSGAFLLSSEGMVAPLVDGTVKLALTQAGLLAADGTGTVTAEAAEKLALFLPSGLAITWIIVLGGNLWAARALIARSGRPAPPPVAGESLELPPRLLWLWGGALALGLLPGDTGYLFRNTAVVLAVPYFCLGLATIHATSRAFPARTLVLAVLYVFVLGMGWPAVLVAVLGLVEQEVGLRQRFAPPRDPPKEA